MPDDTWTSQEMPQFLEEHTGGMAGVQLEAFPASDLPSGGMSSRISASEMYMVMTCVPCRHIWKDPKGKVLADLPNATYSFVGRFPWEIVAPGMHRCELLRNGKPEGFVEFEVT